MVMDKKNALSKTQVIPELSPSEYGEELSAGENFNVSRVKKVKCFFNFLHLLLIQKKTGAIGVILGLMVVVFILSTAFIQSLKIIDENHAIPHEGEGRLIRQLSHVKKITESEKATAYRNNIQIKKYQDEIAVGKKQLELLQLQLVTKDKLAHMSAQNDESVANLKKMLTNSVQSLESTKKQLDVITSANATLSDEVQRLRLLRKEVSQISESSVLRNASNQDLKWTAWIGSEDVNSFLRESIERKAYIPLACEGRLTGGGIAYRFFVIPNLYQLRWEIAVNLTDEGLISQISNSGRKKYYELYRQSFLVNSTSPRYQVVLIHQLDIEEARRLKSRYLEKQASFGAG
jgi:flagellar motor protein MotB